MEDADSKEEAKLIKAAPKLFEHKLNYTESEIKNIRKEFEANEKLIESLRKQKQDCDDQKFQIQKENKVLTTEIEILKTKWKQISKEFGHFSTYCVHKLKSSISEDNCVSKIPL